MRITNKRSACSQLHFYTKKNARREEGNIQYCNSHKHAWERASLPHKLDFPKGYAPIQEETL